MKTLTKITLLAAGIAAAVLPLLSAPDASKRANRAQQLGDRPALRALVRQKAVRRHVARKLDLTTEQISQLKTARGETRTSLQAIRADTSLTTDQKKAKVREVLQATRGEVRGMLTPEQRQKLGKMRERARDFRSGRN